MSHEHIILLDMDGVIVNFIDGIIKSLELDLSHDDWATWDYHEKLGISKSAFWRAMHEKDWWRSLLPYPWASELVRELKKDYEVVYCTSPSLDSSCPSQKIEWLRDYCFMGMENAYQIGPMKCLNARSGAILIDDYDVNVDNYRMAGGRAITFPQAWNSAGVSEDRVGHIMKELEALLCNG